MLLQLLFLNLPCFITSIILNKYNYFNLSILLFNRSILRSSTLILSCALIDCFSKYLAFLHVDAVNFFNCDISFFSCFVCVRSCFNLVVFFCIWNTYTFEKKFTAMIIPATATNSMTTFNMLIDWMDMVFVVL